jgi:TonB family protein
LNSSITSGVPISFRAAVGLMVASLFVAAPGFADERNFGDAYNQLAHGDTQAGMRTLSALAEAGDSRAQYFLGVAMMEGQDISRDLVRGYAWIEIAADCQTLCTDDRAAFRARDARLLLGRQLTGSQLLESERIAEEYLQPKMRSFDAIKSAAESALRSGTNVPGVTPYDGCAMTPDSHSCMRVMGGISTVCEGVNGAPDQPASSAGPLARIVRPKYPTSAREDSAEGPINFVAYVDDSGYLCKAAIVRGSGTEAIDLAAMDAVLRWRLDPATKAGVPVESIYAFKVTFSISDFLLK